MSRLVVFRDDNVPSAGVRVHGILSGKLSGLGIANHIHIVFGVGINASSEVLARAYEEHTTEHVFMKRSCAKEERCMNGHASIIFVHTGRSIVKASPMKNEFQLTSERGLPLGCLIAKVVIIGLRVTANRTYIVSERRITASIQHAHAQARTNKNSISCATCAENMANATLHCP